MKHIIYLHGFGSSPLSTKAQLTLKYFQDKGLESFLHLPDLTLSPEAAIAKIKGIIEEVGLDNIAGFIGSSLGGYYAHYCSERFKKPAVLINPAVRPFELLESKIGEIELYHGQGKAEFKADYLQQLKNLFSEVTAERLLVLLQTGDETLDYRQAQLKFENCSLYVGLGGNHSFEDFQDFLPQIERFLLKSDL